MIDALIAKRVDIALLEINIAANLQDTLQQNRLKIAKEIKSTTGIGMVLSAEMAGLHKEVRAYVRNNAEMIQGLVSNFTEKVKVSKSDDDTPCDSMDSANTLLNQ